MHRDGTQIELLRLILENMLQPRRLDSHPWTKSLIVVQARLDSPDLLTKSPGQQLVEAIAKVFRQMMPSTPPKQGKRLDTRWGEFGILAAQYFSPYLFGEPSPASLREAWGGIDKSILLFVFGDREDVAQAEKDLYCLVGGEPSIAPTSTLSDWNRNGLRRLVELVLARERFLAGSLSKPMLIGQEDEPAADNFRKSDRAGSPRKHIIRNRIFLFTGLFLIAALIGVGIYAGLKAREIYQAAWVLRQDAVELQSVVKGSGSPIERVKAAGGPFSKLKLDYGTLKAKVEPWLWLTPWLKWVPDHGGDIASVPRLLALADPLLNSVDQAYQALAPLLDSELAAGVDPTSLTSFLANAKPQLIQAGHLLNQAVTARDEIPLADLSPQVRTLIEGDLDPILGYMQDGLTFAEGLPTLLGASEEGPKTYLLLVENEDELRPTGGFITAVGTLLMQNGKIANMAFENSGDLDDWTKPYPAAPWQLQEYMNSPVLVLRDTNWFTNFPTAALYAETLYSYIDPHSEDGVIAFDQQALVYILQTTGPVVLKDVSTPIDSSNVISYMRSAKTPTTDQAKSSDWNNKLFMTKIASALAEKIFSGSISLEQFTTLLLKLFNEHHVLVQLDDPYLSQLMAKYHWDGAIHHANGDFLMVVDSNVGFNKTNAVVGSSLDYDVDLTTPLSPVGTLTIVHQNNSPELICKQWFKIRPEEEKNYPITDCYWNYLRVYVPKGTELLDSSTQNIPAAWLIGMKDISAQVDSLDEGIVNIQTFGTLQVVPGGESLTTSFHFALPPAVMAQPHPNQFQYHLKLQKQPGTKATPITLRIHVPGNAAIQQVPAGAVVQNNSILLQTDLRIDREIEVLFSLP